MKSRDGQLADLLLKVFVGDEMARFARQYQEGESVAHSLPPGLSPAATAAAIVDAWKARDLLGQDLFDALRAERPTRGEAITAVARLYAEAWSPEGDVIAWYRGRVLARHARLVPFFPGAARHALATVYVEVCVATRDGHGGQAMPLERLLASDPRGRWFLVGEPGAGKTTLLRYLAHDLASRKEGPLPLFVSLAEVAAHPQWDVARQVAEACRESGGPPVEALAATLRTEVEAGRAWLLLDGLDEVPGDAATWGAFLGWWERMVRIPAPVCVATRAPALARRGFGAGFVRVEPGRLDQGRQEELLDKLLGEEAGPVKDELRRRPALSSLGRNPLLLTLLAVVGREEAKGGRPLPARRVGLYAEAVSLLLERGFGLVPRGVKDREAARLVLRRLAWRLHQLPAEAWERHEVRRHLVAGMDEDRELGNEVRQAWARRDTRGDQLGDAAAALDDLCDNSGVLAPHDGPGQKWRFLHRTLREFLVAEHLAGTPDAREEVARAFVAETKARKGEEVTRWGEVIALLCGLVEDPLAELQRLRALDPGIARRAVRDADVAPEVAFRYLLADPGAGDEDVLALAQAHRGDPVLPGAILACVAEASPFHRAVLAYALAQVGAFEAGRFFETCGLAGARPALVRCEVPGGRFVMGSERGLPKQAPRHEVTLSRAYALSRTPVTNEQYRALVPYHAPGEDGALPVAYVSWYEARLYAAWVGGRLPTEAEWERACRGGNDADQDYWSGNGEGSLAAVGWYDGNSGRQRQPAGRPPGSGRPAAAGEPAAGAALEHPWKLLDLHGNVWEWCEDWHGPYGGAATDPRGPGAGGGRVLRGGSSWAGPDRCRSAYRFRGLPWRRVGFVGFRVCFPAPSRSSLGP